MTDREKYLFDLQGFVIIRGVLSDDQLSRLNAAIDANMDKRTVRWEHAFTPPKLVGKHALATMGGMLEWDHPWCDPFRELIVPVKLISHLDTLLGRQWKAQRDQQFIHAYPESEGLHFHLGDPHFSPLMYYVYGNGQMRNGLLVVSYQLTDTPPGCGGFSCIPGSHKANFMRPAGIDDWELDQEIFVTPICQAGDVVIFTEALTHGTLPWTADHERRSLLWRFWPRALSHWGGFGQALPAWFDELTDAQRAVLTPPRALDEPQAFIARDGSVVYADTDWDEAPHRYFVNRTHLYEGPPEWIEPPVRIDTGGKYQPAT